MSSPTIKMKIPLRTSATTESLTDMSAYPILTEEVGYPPSPLATPSGTQPPVPGSAPIGQIALKAVADVLGWKPKPGDVKGFVGALTQSFTLTDVEGHVQAAWTPRTYAVQTDLSGGITGAQASIYSRAKDALDQSLPLLDGLYSLDPEADAEDVAALKAVSRSQLNELVNELGQLGGPRVMRVNQYFNLLLGDGTFPKSPLPNTPLTITDPDQIGGTLGNLRDELGLNFTRQDFVNSVEDEQDLSNFRVLSDYVTSLAQSWINNLGFFGLNTTTPFFGTQLVLLSRQLSVVAESVDEVRFTLDSVFIGPAERQTLQLNFKNPADPPMFAEDLFTWIQGFASEEGPRLIQEGGKFGVQNTFVPVAAQLARLLGALVDPNPGLHVPAAFHTPRVQRSLRQLLGELRELVKLATPIKHTVTPEPDFGLPFAVIGIEPNTISSLSLPPRIYVKGTGFESVPAVSIFPHPTGANIVTKAFFRSENLLAVTLQPSVLPGSYDLQVTNADGTPAPVLKRALSIT